MDWLRAPALAAACIAVLSGCSDEPPGATGDGGVEDAGAAIGQLDGNPNDLAREHLPDIAFGAPNDEDFTEDGILLRELSVVITQDATVGGVNELLAASGASIVGADPESDAILLIGDWPTRDALAAAQSTFEASAVIEVAIVGTAFEVELLPPSDTAANRWVWDHGPPTEETRGRGNWGLQHIRAPQMWNLDTFVQRRRRNQRFEVGVVDIGFTDVGTSSRASSHPYFVRADDSDILQIEPAPGEPLHLHNHGTGVAGVIGAAWDDRAQTAGVDPWVKTIRATHFSRTANGRSTGYRVTDGIVRLLRRPEVRVVNASVGMSQRYKELDIADNGRNDGSFQPDVSAPLGEAAYLAKRLEALARAGRGRRFVRSEPYLLVGSAGNAGNGFRAIDTSAVTALSTALPERSLSVGSVTRGDTLARHSHIGADLLAPGECIGTPENPDTPQFIQPGCPFPGDQNTFFTVQTGTSFAAPHVAGLASVLWVLDPSLLTRQIIQTLTAPDATVDIPGQGKRIDAFAAAMKLDQGLRGDPKQLQRALVNIDDGTVDGNQRVDPNGMEDARIHTPDQRRGDRDGETDRISMADFRALRDATTLAMVARDPSLASRVDLDGSPLHFKNDTNEDGCVGTTVVAPPWPSRPPARECLNAPGEDVFPRADFNGDGTLGTGRTKFLGNDWRDVDVLMDVWPSDVDATEGWPAAELPRLLPTVDGQGGSADLRIDLGQSIASSDYDRVTISVSGAMPTERELTSGRHMVWTVPIAPLPTVTATGHRRDGGTDALCGSPIDALLIGQDQPVRLSLCGNDRLEIDESQIFAQQRYSAMPGTIVDAGSESGPMERIVVPCAMLTVGGDPCVVDHTTSARGGGRVRLVLRRINTMDYDVTVSVRQTPTLLPLPVPPMTGLGCGDPIPGPPPGRIAWCESATQAPLEIDLHLNPGIPDSQRMTLTCRVEAMTTEAGNATPTQPPPLAELTAFYGGEAGKLGQIGGCFVSSIASHQMAFDETSVGVVDPEMGPMPGPRTLRINVRTSANGGRFFQDADRTRIQTLTSTAHVMVRVGP